MRDKKTLAGSLIGVTTLIALTPALAGATAPTAASSPATNAVDRAATTSLETKAGTRERGNVIECTGTYRGSETFVSVYENNRYANVLQVVVGDDGLGKSREVEKGFIDGTHVNGKLRLQGKKVTITGTAKRVGPRVSVHEEHDDAGQHIVIDGFHRALDTRLKMSWKGTTIRLDCDNAFYYNLKVEKTDITS